MILVVDVGNTNTVFGLVDKRKVVHRWRISTLPRTTDELGVLMTQLMRERGRSAVDVQGAIVSCVVPSVLFNLEKACSTYFGCTALVVGRKLRTGIKLRTDNPRELGADRIVHAVAALEQFGSPVLVVTFGTALTVDCVNEKGEYVGGAIAPGIRIAEEALFEQTAKLPRVEIVRTERVIHTHTVGAIQAGLFWGFVGMADGLIGRCIDELGGSPHVVATGAMAQLFGPACERVDSIEPLLSLHGLALLYERNA